MYSQELIISWYSWDRSYLMLKIVKNYKGKSVVGDLRVWDQIYWDTLVLLGDFPCINAPFSHRLA